MNKLIDKFKIYGLRRFFVFALFELKNKLWLELIKGSYSQHGEDLLIDKLLGFKKKGFYVDVGAYDPHRFSNTKRFYLRGWRGINIEPDTANYKKFVNDRKRDTNLNLGIGKDNAELTFHQFFPDTLSTFSKREAEDYKIKGFRLIHKKTVQVKKLSSILETYCKKTAIDFFSIDTEGYDLEVLKSNNWKKFRPRLICIETNQKSKNINSFLRKHGYNVVFQNNVNSIYIYD